jgi:hypothetical protein
LGIRTAKASILHFEPLLLSAKDRQGKLRRYAQLGGSKEAEAQFNIPPGVTTLPATLPAITLGQPGNRIADSDLAIHRLPKRVQPRWGCKILSVDAPQTASPGESLVFQAHVENTGGLAWWPSTGGRHSINLGNHLFDVSGALLAHGRGRSAVLQIVAPGETSVIIDKFAAPSEPGTYMLEWDMVSEGECWFASLGCKTVRTVLAVIDPERGDPVASTIE